MAVSASSAQENIREDRNQIQKTKDVPAAVADAALFDPVFSVRNAIPCTNRKTRKSGTEHCGEEVNIEFCPKIQIVEHNFSDIIV